MVLLYLLDLSSNRLLSVTPDGATVLLEGHSIATGNLALSGWSLSLDSFWGIDAAFYAVVVRIVGIHADLLHFVPALLAVLVIAACVLLAREHRRGLPAVVAGGVVIALLALPSPDLAYYLLQGPWHVGTALYCLLAFRALARGRFDWWFAVAVVLLAAGLLGDLLTLAFGVLPCIAAAAAAMLRGRRLRSGLPLAAAGVGSVALALIVRAISQAIGAFTLVNRNIVVRGPQIVANIGHLGNRLPALLGSATIPLKGFPNGSGTDQLLHGVGVAVVVVGVAAVLYSAVHGAARRRQDSPTETISWQFEQLLLFGVLFDLVVYAWGSPNGHAEFAKYLTPGIVFAVLLAARVAGRFTERLPHKAALAVLVTGGVLACLYAAEFASTLFLVSPVQEASSLTRFLAAHQLTNGVGDYWSASLVTVDSSGRIAVRPISTTAGGRIDRFARQSSSDWYSAPFQFLVYDTARPWHDVDAETATATYGAPTHTYAVGSYRVLTYAKPFTVAGVPATSASPLNIFWSLSAGAQTRPAR